MVLDGEVVNEIDVDRHVGGDRNPDGSEVPEPLRGADWSTMARSGRIGLQGREDAAGTEFRRLKLLRLPPTR